MNEGFTLWFTGLSGAGKTVFAKGLAIALGVAGEGVRSPTFTLVNIYPGPFPVYHIDLYRTLRIMQIQNGKSSFVTIWRPKKVPLTAKV